MTIVTCDSAAKGAVLFDLDGTLVDSVYPHVLAWRAALGALGIWLDVWRFHRRIGMSGGLMANAILRETVRWSTMRAVQTCAYAQIAPGCEHRHSVRPLNLLFYR